MPFWADFDSCDKFHLANREFGSSDGVPGHVTFSTLECDFFEFLIGRISKSINARRFGQKPSST